MKKLKSRKRPKFVIESKLFLTDEAIESVFHLNGLPMTVKSIPLIRSREGNFYPIKCVSDFLGTNPSSHWSSLNFVK